MEVGHTVKHVYKNCDLAAPYLLACLAQSVRSCCSSCSLGVYFPPSCRSKTAGSVNSEWNTKVFVETTCSCSAHSALCTPCTPYVFGYRPPTKIIRCRLTTIQDISRGVDYDTDSRCQLILTKNEQTRSFRKIVTESFLWLYGVHWYSK